MQTLWATVEKTSAQHHPPLYFWQLNLLMCALELILVSFLFAVVT